MSSERLLGSYLVRVSIDRHERRVAVHSVLTGERRRCADFADLAAYLETATSEAARLLTRRADEWPGTPERLDAGDTGTEGHGR